MKDIFHDGELINIDHLAPTQIGCECSEIQRDLVIAVTFSNHCYTEGFDESIHSADQIVVYDSGSRPRVFCPIRHGLSHRLPDLITGLPNRKVYQTAEQRNYVFSVPLEIAGQNYHVFFMIQRAEKKEAVDLRLTVESAYPIDGAAPVLPKRPGSIRFKVLALKTLLREPIRFAPR